jgi:plasmid maintenance system antidote protein VapI
MKKHIPLSDQVRQVIETSGKTRYVISKETGIGQDTLSLFVNGKRGLSMEVLDKLGEYLGLRVVADMPDKRAKGR